VGRARPGPRPAGQHAGHEAHLGGVESEDAVEARHRRIQAFARDGTGRMFLILVAGAADPVGSVGYWEREWRGETVYEMGWKVLPAWQGRGLAAAAAATAAGLAAAERRRRWAHAYPRIDNAASHAVCRRAGFELVGECDFDYPRGHPIRCHDWRIDLAAVAGPAVRAGAAPGRRRPVHGLGRQAVLRSVAWSRWRGGWVGPLRVAVRGERRGSVAGPRRARSSTRAVKEVGRARWEAADAETATDVECGRAMADGCGLTADGRFDRIGRSVAVHPARRTPGARRRRTMGQPWRATRSRSGEEVTSVLPLPAGRHPEPPDVLTEDHRAVAAAPARAAPGPDTPRPRW
jgi:RimJ/RimL family protein N-acetyltransferase